MYGLAADIDLSFFHNQPLLQVCIGYNEVILHFGDTVSLTVQTDIGHKSKAGELTAVYKSIIPSTTMLVGLINLTVKRAFVTTPGTLVLEFSNAEMLEIYDTSAEYESYIIKNGEAVIVV